MDDSAAEKSLVRSALGRGCDWPMGAAPRSRRLFLFLFLFLFFFFFLFFFPLQLDWRYRWVLLAACMRGKYLRLHVHPGTQSTQSKGALPVHETIVLHYDILTSWLPGLWPV